MRSIIICPDREVSGRLESALEILQEIIITRTLTDYPDAVDLMRLLRVTSAEVVFLSFESVEPAQRIAELMEREAGGVQVIGVHRKMDPVMLRETMRAGVRECVIYPFEQDALIEALVHVYSLLERRPVAAGSDGQVFAFLPSKAGVGASTTALNVAAALARDSGKKVLLADFDLGSGMLRFMLKLTNGFSVLDAIEHSSNMEEQFWPQFVTKIDGLDVMHAGRFNQNFNFEPSQIRNLLGFMRMHYDFIFLDLSGNLEPYATELMLESKRVLLVCTPEIASLHLAREKMDFLRTREIGGRVSVLLNRLNKGSSMAVRDVEDMIQTPIAGVFPNDYQAATRALAAGTNIAPGSEIGKSFEQFARNLLDPKGVAPAENKRRFLDFLAIPRSPLGSRGW